MASAVVQDQLFYCDPFTSSASAEAIPVIPETTFWLQLKEAQESLPYTMPIDWAGSSSVFGPKPTVEELTKAEKLSIIKNAHKSLNANIRDIDPDIRKLVNDNFKKMVWK